MAAAGQYPGMAGSTGDSVLFDTISAGPATVDVSVNPLRDLQFTNWTDKLTVNNSLRVTGNTGSFILEDASTITLASNKVLNLLDMGTPGSSAGLWTNGTITGGDGSALTVYGSGVNIQEGPATLGTNLVLGKSAQTGNMGFVNLSAMTSNLLLNGTSNIIDVVNGGLLELYQGITTNGTQNTVGGIVLGGGHTGPVAIQVESGGKVFRDGFTTTGVPNQILIGGAVYNTGGTVEIGLTNMLKISGADGSGYSYWQKDGSSALLQLDDGANIAASGTYQIDIGTVQFTAPAGGTTDELDGGGLTFANANPTALTFTDKTPGTPGTVQVTGPVTLAANTTTTMNFTGAMNTADQLSVVGGALTLAGKLRLKSGGMMGKPTKPLNVFQNAAIAGNFASITDDVNGTDTGAVVGNFYQVTIK